jgi:hypothetical protein
VSTWWGEGLLAMVHERVYDQCRCLALEFDCLVAKQPSTHLLLFEYVSVPKFITVDLPSPKL